MRWLVSVGLVKLLWMMIVWGLGCEEKERGESNQGGETTLPFFRVQAFPGKEQEEEEGTLRNI